MTDSFWTGGPSAYAKGLREQYEPQLLALRKRLESVAPSEQADLEAELNQIAAEYKSKLNKIDDAIF